MHSHPLIAAVNGAVLPRELTLSITEEANLEWRGKTDHGMQPLAEIRHIRLWAEYSGVGRPAGRAEIRFADGTRIWVSGATRTGASDIDRARVYRAFLQRLHDTLTAQQKAEIAFRRGLANGSPAKGWTAFAVCLALDVALVGFFWNHMREDVQWIARPILVVFGLAGVVLAASVGQAMAGRSYDPNALPDDLLPS